MCDIRRPHDVDGDGFLNETGQQAEKAVEHLGDGDGLGVKTALA